MATSKQEVLSRTSAREESLRQEIESKIAQLDGDTYFAVDVMSYTNNTVERLKKEYEDAGWTVNFENEDRPTSRLLHFK